MSDIFQRIKESRTKNEVVVEEQEIVKFSIFKYIDETIIKKEEGLVTSTQNQCDDVYMLLRFLSMNPTYFLDIWYVNLLSNDLPKWAVCNLIYHLIPKRRTPLKSNYLKGDVKKETKEYKEVIKRLGQRFCCSMEHAVQLFNIYKNAGFDIYVAFGMKGKM